VNGQPAAPLHVLDSSHGLGSNQIHRLASDAQSRLLLATPVGLARFDGSFTHSWNRQNGLRCNGLRSVAMATDQGLELLGADGKPEAGVDPDAWRFGLCQDIKVSGQCAWVASALGLVRVDRPLGGLGFQTTFFADVGFVARLHCISEQRVLAATGVHGLVETDGKTWWPYRCAELVGRKTLCVEATKGGKLLVGTEAGVYVVDDGKAVVVGRLTPPDAAPGVSAIAVSHDRWWVAFGRTLIAFSTDAVNPIVLERFSVDSDINDLLLDALGNVWIATNAHGLAKVSCLRLAIRHIDMGRPGGVYSIKPATPGVFAIGGEKLFGKLTLSDDSAPAFLNEYGDLPETIVWDSFEDEHGIWAATQAGLFHAPRGGQFALVFGDDLMLGSPGRVILSRAGELWVGSLRGLCRIRGNVAEPVDAAGVPLGYVYALHLDDTSALWIGTLGRGLWREHDGMHPITIGPLSATGNTYAVTQGSDGTVIILQDEHVVLLDRDLTFRIVATLAPVAGWSVCWIDTQTVAIGASDGLRILDLVTGNITRTVQALFPLRSWEFTNNRTLIRDDRGRFLCGVTGGLLRVDLALLDAYDPPVCKLADIVWRDVEPDRDGETFRLRSGRWSFTLRAFAAWQVDSSQVRYQFQLLGFDNKWSGYMERPEITFTSLPPGTYRLLARAHSQLVGSGPEVQLMELEVRQPLWAMGWSAAFLAFESGYDWLIRSRSRNRTLLQANRELEQAVADRTAALHDSNHELIAMRDVYQRLSEVDELTGLGNRRNFEKELRRTMKLAQRLQLPLTLLMVDVDYFKGVNDEYGHPVGDDYLRKIAQVLTSVVRIGEDTASRYGGEEFAVLLVNTEIHGAAVVAERILTSVRSLGLRNVRSPHGVVTVSIGLSTVGTGEVVASDALVARADAALYLAKDQGRNRVVAHA
jgi:diguanylate cyclase (GGDEF)-like protein